MNIDNKTSVEYSPAADLPRNRDQQFKKFPRRQMKNDSEDINFLSPVAPATSSASNNQVFEIPKLDTLRFKPIKTLASRIDGTEYCDESSTDKILEMLEIGQVDQAVAYTDTLYSNFVGENDEEVDIVALADYVKILTILRQWRRISHLIAKRNYHQIHIVFAYYAVIALFHRKLYEEVTDLPVGHLITNTTNQILPLKSPSQITGRHVEEERMKYSFANMSELDQISRRLRLAPALMLTIAESYLKLMNRDAAMLCISYAVNNDTTPVHVERLMTKYNLVEPSEWEKYREIRKTQLDLHEGNMDPKILIEKAQNCYEMGRFLEAKKLTDVVFDNYGPHQECLILRIHCMTMLKDSRGLLELGNQLVADDPHVALPWYCVALYYYTVGANARARSFISKCTVMDTTFAEAWVAFGHILHYEVEHEQSMSCYYRASKLVDRSSEPFLYVALQYSSNSQKLSKKFMSEAVSRSPKDPLIRHEEACIAYTAGNYEEADKLFRQVLYMVTESPEIMDVKDVLKKKFEDFWRPMINNLGHISRRMNRIEEAIMFHQRAVSMEPKYVDAIASIAICYTVLDNASMATEYYNRALAIDPFNEAVRQCMSRMILSQMVLFDSDGTFEEEAKDDVAKMHDFGIDRFDMGEYRQQPLPHSSIRMPHDDAWVVQPLPVCDDPILTLNTDIFEQRSGSAIVSFEPPSPNQG